LEHQEPITRGNIVIAIFKPFEQERLWHVMEEPEFREATARRAQRAVACMIM
jgi:hypothetical protein